jgi:predicted CXXCH cytochrome family protein
MGTDYPLLPGGDFYYAQTDPRKGHNPVGTALGSDNRLTQAPGGVFASAQESCISCHDPHGGSSANAYRLLRKKPAGWTGPDLLIEGKETHPGSDEGGPRNETSPRYYSGFSAWCGACHSNPDNAGSGFHGASLTDPDVGNGADWIRHPCDKALGETIAGNYGTPYLLPYHVEKVAGPDSEVTAQDEVFCLSCHRAHAWKYAHATHWDNTVASGPGTGCNKCHAKGQ